MDIRTPQAPFRRGVETRTPVVPIAIRGTRSILRAGSWFPRRGAVSVAIGRPIRPETLGSTVDGDRWALALELRDRTGAFIGRHSGEPDLGYERPPFRPARPTPSKDIDQSGR